MRGIDGAGGGADGGAGSPALGYAAIEIIKEIEEEGRVIRESGSELIEKTTKIPESLLKGVQNTRVYLGIKDGVARYVGITVDILTRQAQHGERFDYLQEITKSDMPRRAARAIEQVLIENNPHFENAINSIGKNRDWYGEAVEWGTKWLNDTGITIFQ